MSVDHWSLYDTQPSFVLGFHGCDSEIGEAILSGKAAHLAASTNEYDWLGNGIYFWESNPQRALEFATEGMKGRVTKGKIKNPFVVGAVIDLGRCLNLVNSSSFTHLAGAYQLLVAKHAADQKPIPANGKEFLTRALDCAVFETLHHFRKTSGYPEYDTVRGVFWEGKPIYDGTALYDKNHIQICVRDESCIMGYFRPIIAAAR